MGTGGQRFLAVLAILVAFGAGGASGFIVARSRWTHTAADIPSRSEVMEAIADECGLTPEQREKMRKIADELHPRVVAAKATIAGEVAAVRSELRARVKSEVLASDEQRALFDEVCKKRDAQRELADK